MCLAVPRSVPRQAGCAEPGVPLCSGLCQRPGAPRCCASFPGSVYTAQQRSSAAQSRAGFAGPLWGYSRQCEGGQGCGTHPSTVSSGTVGTLPSKPPGGSRGRWARSPVCVGRCSPSPAPHLPQGPGWGRLLVSVLQGISWWGRLLPCHKSRPVPYSLWWAESGAVNVVSMLVTVSVPAAFLL